MNDCVPLWFALQEVAKKPYQFLLVNVLREYLQRELYVPTPFPFEKERVFDDFGERGRKNFLWGELLLFSEDEDRRVISSCRGHCLWHLRVLFYSTPERCAGPSSGAY